MKEYATGFSGLGDSRFDVGTALTDTRLPPGSESLPSLNIARVKALALGYRLRTETFTTASLANEDNATRLAVAQRQMLRDLMASDHSPADWGIFFKLATDVEASLHGGTMGWTDEAFYDGVTRFLDAQHAPSDAQAAWRLLHAAAGYRWPAAAADVDAVVSARVRGHRWLDDNLLRDAAVVALLKTGAPARAHGVFDQLSPFVTRKSDDLRVLMLSEHIAAAERHRAPFPP
ncbi:MAG: hypothetical protein KGK07_17640 [Chloroflexota bacterium]|nr:hypothetical protein [Chloroflexota bacterium]